MKQIGLILAVTIGFTLPPALGSVEFLWGVSGPTGSRLYAINPRSGQILKTVGTPGVNLSGLAIRSGTLLAVQPNKSPNASDAKRLFVVNKTKGTVTTVGSMDPKYAIADLAIRADGTLFAWGPQGGVKKLLVINPGTAAVSEIGSNIAGTSEVGITFDGAGSLWLVRTNGLFKIDPATGNNLNGNMGAVIPLNGATTQFDNMLATNAAGVVVGAARTGGNTQLFSLNTVTGLTTLLATVPGVGLTGITFDVALPPKVSISGKKRPVVKTKSYTLKGTATSVLALTVKAKGKSAKVVNGKWSLKVALKRGKNPVTVVCADGMGQSAKTKITIVRK